MTAAALILAVAATFALALIARAIRAHTLEVRAIADREAEERRNLRLDANKAAFDRLGVTR